MIRKLIVSLMAVSVVAAGLFINPIAAAETPLRFNSRTDTGVPAGVSWTAKERACLNGMMVYGHRGYVSKGTMNVGGRRVSENTLQSFALARNSGACGYETDVRQTRGGSCLVLHHDSTWSRMTRKGGRVSGTTCARALRIRTNGGQLTATPYQAIDAAARSSSCFGLMELKRGATSRTNLVKLMRYAAYRLKSPECLLFTSGNLSMLLLVKSVYARELKKNSRAAFPTGWIRFGAYDHPAVSQVPWYVDRLMLDYRAVTPSYTRAARTMGLGVSERNIDTAALFHHAKAEGAENVVTNRVGSVGRMR